LTYLPMSSEAMDIRAVRDSLSKLERRQNYRHE
jgi:hypothetical protein